MKPPLTNRKADVLMPTDTPRQESITVPIEFLTNNLTEGRFSVSDDIHGDRATFFAVDIVKPRERMSFKTRSVLGAIRLRQVVFADQTPVVRAYILPDGRVLTLGWSASKAQDLLLRALSNPWESARNYSKYMGRCCRCGASLIDDRSRWYGIGPECEKHWPQYIALVNDEQGVFQP